MDAELHWYEAHGIGKRELIQEADPMNERHFAVCISNEGYRASLQLRKIYEVLDDALGAEHTMVRIIDESGEDYLYPAAWFAPLDLPESIADAVAAAAAREHATPA